MKKHTTNYYNTFIEVAEDTRVTQGTVPVSRGDQKTVAERQFSLITSHPYAYTSDDVLFQVYADRNELLSTEYEAARHQFFSKGQPCFRASPLAQTQGFGIHHDQDGKVAIYGMETPDYERLLKDEAVKKVKAMRSSK